MSSEYKQAQAYKYAYAIRNIVKDNDKIIINRDIVLVLISY